MQQSALLNLDQRSFDSAACGTCVCIKAAYFDALKIILDTVLAFKQIKMGYVYAQLVGTASIALYIAYHRAIAYNFQNTHTQRYP